MTRRSHTFGPALATAPPDWVISLVLVGDGRQFDGPGNIAVDADGNYWINNNYTKSRDLTKVCGGKQVFKMYPFEKGAPAVAHSGGGLNGAGFGIGIDTRGDIWVGNFGFKGRLCPTPPPATSVSRFRPDGTAVSGPNGYTADIAAPQATLGDRRGNVWIANCASGNLTKYPDGEHRRSQVVSTQVDKAFDIAFDRRDRVYVTSNANDAVYGFHNDGRPLAGSPFKGRKIDRPYGIKSDSRGNLWVANAGVPTPPCSSSDPALVPPPKGKAGSLALLDGTSRISSGTGGGMTMPWAVALDGNDNVWVSNFSGQRVSNICGVRVRTCSKGRSTGEGISPRRTGYFTRGLQRSTGLVVDASGNVVVTNNWKRLPAQVNPGGNGIVVMLGVAGPVRTPSIGVPQRP